MSHRRIDQVTFDAKNLTRTPQGFVKVPARVTRVGVFKYKMKDGSILRELRPPEEVFAKDSMDSLMGIPFTYRHPKSLVNSTNARSHTVGYTGQEVSKDDIYLAAPVTIIDEDTIQQVERGTVEVSCGYTCDKEEKPGVWEGEAYDVVQRNIRYNHVALVEKGRAGQNVRLILDSDTAILDGLDLEHNQTPGGGAMEKITLEGKEFEVAPELAAMIKKMMSSTDEMKKEMDGVRGNMADMQKKYDESMKAKDAVQGKCDSLEQELKARKDSASDDKIEARVQKRIRVLKIAGSVLGEEKMDSLSDKEIMTKVCVKKGASADKLKDQSEDYLTARFDAIAEMVEGTAQAVADAEKKNQQRRNDGADEGSAEKARQRQTENAQKAWETYKPGKKGE